MNRTKSIILNVVAGIATLGVILGVMWLLEPKATSGSDGSVYLYNGDGRISNSADKQWAWDDAALFAPSDKDINQTFKCPANSARIYTFISDRGKERVKLEWRSFGYNGFKPGTTEALQVNVSPVYTLDGGTTGQSLLKANGGKFSLGFACVAEDDKTVLKTFFRFISVEGGSGNWTALPNAN